MKNSTKTIQVGLIGALCVGLLTGCTNGNYKSRKNSPEEQTAWYEKLGLTDQDKNDPAADAGGDTLKDGGQTPEGEAPKQDTAKDGGATEAVIPAEEVKGTETEIPFTPVDRPEGTTIVEEDVEAEAATLIGSNNELLTKEKNAEASKLIQAITIEGLGDANQVAWKLHGVVFGLSESGNFEQRLVRIDNASVKVVERVENASFMLSKDLYDQEGVKPGKSIIISAVCKTDCSVVQIRMMFLTQKAASAEEKDVYTSAVFELTGDASGKYTVSATNLTSEYDMFKRFDDAVKEMADQGVAAPEGVAAEGTPAADTTATGPQGTTAQGATDQASADAAAKAEEQKKKTIQMYTEYGQGRARAEADARAAADAKKAEADKKLVIQQYTEYGQGRAKADADARAEAARKAEEAKKAEELRLLRFKAATTTNGSIDPYVAMQIQRAEAVQKANEAAAKAKADADRQALIAKGRAATGKGPQP